MIDRMSTLAREKFAPRAANYDLTATFPAEDFDDLFRAGLHAPVVPREYGGLGLGPYRGDVLTLWMMTKEIAKANRTPKFRVRGYNRCKLCGRPRAYIRKFGMCRICFRENALTGKLPGVVKSSW